MYIILLYFAQASERIMEIIEQYSDLTAINVNGSIYILKNIVWQLSATVILSTQPLVILRLTTQYCQPQGYRHTNILARTFG